MRRLPSLLPADVISRYTRTLGDELRRRRTTLRWTRKSMLAVYTAQTHDDMSVQTLATYELGTRNMAIERLDRVARTLGTFAGVVLTDVDRRMYSTPATLTVNLLMLARTTRPELAPAAKWAAVHCTNVINPVTELSDDALTQLAELCDLDFTTLTVALQQFQHTHR
jgi:hypothetical protein